MKVLIMILFMSFSSYARWATKQDFNYWLLSEAVSIKVHKDGKFSAQLTAEYEVLKEKGRERFAIFKIPYKSSSSEIKSIEMKVINGQKISSPGPEKFIHKSVSKEKILDDSMEVQVALPDVQVGSKISLKMNVVSKENIFAGYYSTVFNFGEMNQTDSSHIEIDSEIPLFTYANDPFHFLKQSEKKVGDHYKYTIDLKRAYLRQVVDEQSVLDSSKKTFVLVSSEKDWSRISENIKANFEAALSETLPEELTPVITQAKSIKSTVDQMNFLVSFITQKLNYVGDWKSLSGAFSPRTLAEITKTKYGDCKDYSVLLAAMLRKLGHKADIALVLRAPSYSLSDTSLYKLPSMAAFNHAIVKFEEAGKVYWIDPTNPVSFSLNHRDDIAGRPVLALDGRHVLEKIPDESPDKGTFILTKIINFRGATAVNAIADIRLNGHMALPFTGVEAKVGKEKLNAVFMHLVSQGEQLLLPEISPYDLKSQFYRPINVRIKYVPKDIFTAGVEDYKLKLPSLEDLIRPFMANTKGWEGDLPIGESVVFHRNILHKGLFVHQRPRGCQISTPWVDVKREYEFLSVGLKLKDSISYKKRFIRNEEFKTTDFEMLQYKLGDCLKEESVSFLAGASEHADPYMKLEKEIAALNPKERVQKRYEYAKKLVERKNYSHNDLRQILYKNIKEDPDHYKSYHLLRTVALESGYLNGSNFTSASIQEAEKIMDLGLQRFPGHPGFLISKLMHQTYLGNIEAAKTGVGNINIAEVKDFGDLHRLCRLYQSVNQFQKSIETMNMLFKVATNDEEKKLAWFERGQFYSNSKDQVSCVNSYKQVLKYDSKHVYSYINIINCLINSDQFDEAVSMAAEGRKVTQVGMMMINSARALTSRGDHYLKNGKYDLAENDFKEALLYRQNSDSYKGLGTIMASRNDFERAYSLIVEGARFTEADSGGYFLDSYLAFNKSPEHYLKILMKAVALTKSPAIRIRARALLGEKLYALNRKAEMKDHFSRAIHLGESEYRLGNTKVLYDLGFAYFTYGQLEHNQEYIAKAKRYFTEFKMLNPNHIGNNRMLAQFYSNNLGNDRAPASLNDK